MDKIIKNHKINDDEVKRKLLSFLLNKININDYEYISVTEENLNTLKNNEYTISPCHHSEIIYIVITKFINNHYSIYIEKNKIHQYLKNKELNEIFFKPFDVKVNRKLYDDTIIEAFKLHSPSNIYVINNIIYFEGCYKKNIKRSQIFFHLNKTLEKYFNNTKNNYIKFNNIYFFEKNDITELVKNMLSNKYLVKLLFIHDYNNIVTKNNFEYDITSNDNFYINSIIDKKVDIFILKKTFICDVYEIFKNDRFISIAHIPTIDTSHMVKKWFDKYDDDNLYTICTIKKDINDNIKYIPIELVNHKSLIQL